MVTKNTPIFAFYTNVKITRFGHGLLQSKQNLDIDFLQVAFHGKYDDRQCGITFVASEKDTGVWK